MSTESLECTDVIYHHSYFAFDPEDVERNHGFFRYVILEPTRFEVTNIEGDRVEMVTSNLAAILVSHSYSPKQRTLLEQPL